MTPARTVYVKREDEVVWERAQQLAGRSLSSLIAELLARYVAQLHDLEPKVKKIVKRLEKEGIKEAFVRGLLQNELRDHLPSGSITYLAEAVEQIHQDPGLRRAYRLRALDYSPQAFKKEKGKAKAK